MSKKQQVLEDPWRGWGLVGKWTEPENSALNEANASEFFTSTDVGEDIEETKNGTTGVKTDENELTIGPHLR